MLTKLFDALVCETGEFRQFAFVSDRAQFVAARTLSGYHILVGISFA